MTDRQRIGTALLLVESLDPGGYTCAEHDQFFVLPPNIIVPEHIKLLLNELGCRYTKDEGWYFFT